MEGQDGYDEAAILLATGVPLKRPRRWHLLFERMGFVYSLDSVTHLTDLGRQLLASEAEIKAVRRRVGRVAARSLRRYQLDNPSDRKVNARYPDGCTIHPYWAILRAADRLGGRLHWDEMNRELMRLFRDEDVDPAIERIIKARAEEGYDPKQGGTAAFPLKDRAYDGDDNNLRDHVGTPWLRRASAGLLLTNPGSQGDGYWTIPEDLSDIVHEAVSSPPPAFKSFASEEEWFAYYSSLDEGEVPRIDLRLTPKMRRLPKSINLDELTAGIVALKGYYKPDILRQYHSGLNYLDKKHFVILAGVSGTGKTRLVKQYAYAVHGLTDLNDKDPLYFICPVRPDWTDPSGLTGHFDVFKNHYTVPPFLQAVLTANDYPDSPVFVCMDEMNIARVEYYFADVLSAMETEEPLQIHTQNVPVTTSLGFPVRSSVPWPKNLYIVGTINIDETTHPLSHKVLDRAVLIDMSDIDLGVLFKSMGDENADLKWSVEKCEGVLEEINGVLAEYGMPFGYRLAKEFILYHHFWVGKDEAGRDEKSYTAIDDMLDQKVFAKLRGGREQAKMLEQLSAKLKEAGGGDKALPKAKKLIARLQRELEMYGSFQANR